jgi:hypothetical protein
VTAIATVLVLHVLLWRSLAPWYVHLSAPLIVFHTSFFWGYLPMVLGVPVVIGAFGAFAEYLRSRRCGWLSAALAASALATATHVLWLPAVAMIWLAAIWLDPRLFWRVGLLGLMATCLPALPGFLSGMEGGEPPVLRFSTLDAAWNQFKRQWSPFDKGLGRAGGVMLLSGLAVTSWRGRIGASPIRSLALRLFALSLILAFLAPIEISAAGHHAWGVGFRYYVLAFVALAASALSGQRESWLPWVFVAGLAIFSVGLGIAWHRFNQQTRATADALAELPADAALWVDPEQVKLDEFWPAVDQHLAGAHVARGGLFASDLFAGGHIPIRPRGPTPRLTHALMRPDNTPPSGCSDALHASSRWVLYGCQH